MGIKGIIILFAVGGIAASAYYFKDGITDAFASGKEKATNLKDDLQTGYQSNSNSTPVLSDDDNNSKGDGGKGNNSKEDNTQFIYVPIYNNDGQQSTQKGDSKQSSNKQNPEINQYITTDRRKTNDTVSKYTAQADRNNQDAYAKRKYGIDYDTLTKAASKQESKRTIDEKKQIEGARAREIFDSRSINNF